MERRKRGNRDRGNDLHNVTQIISKSQGRSSSEAGLGVKSAACRCCSPAGHLWAARLLSPGGKRGAPRDTQQAGRRAPSDGLCKDAPENRSIFLKVEGRASPSPVLRGSMAIRANGENRKFRPKSHLVHSGKTSRPSSPAFLRFLKHSFQLSVKLNLDEFQQLTRISRS